MIRLEIKNSITLTEKQQKISAFSSGKKIDKNENLAGKEIIPSDQSRVIELAKQIEAKKL